MNWPLNKGQIGDLNKKELELGQFQPNYQKNRSACSISTLRVTRTCFTDALLHWALLP